MHPRSCLTCKHLEYENEETFQKEILIAKLMTKNQQKEFEINCKCGIAVESRYLFTELPLDTLQDNCIYHDSNV